MADQINKDEQIGFHKGALTTLIGERTELVRLVQITDSFIQTHVKALEDLGIKLDLESGNQQKK